MHSAAARANAPAPQPATITEDEPLPRRSIWRRLATMLGVLVVVGAVGAGGWLGYQWTQDQYFVGVDDAGHIAVFRGIPQTVGPLTLSDVVESSRTAAADLPQYFQDRLADTIPADNLTDARARVADLEDEADRT